MYDVLAFTCLSVSNFLRARAATALAHLSHRNCAWSVRLSVRHTGGSVKNQIFTFGCLKDSSFKNRKAFP